MGSPRDALRDGITPSSHFSSPPSTCAWAMGKKDEDNLSQSVCHWGGGGGPWLGPGWAWRSALGPRSPHCGTKTPGSLPPPVTQSEVSPALTAGGEGSRHMWLLPLSTYGAVGPKRPHLPDEEVDFCLVHCRGLWCVSHQDRAQRPERPRQTSAEPRTTRTPDRSNPTWQRLRNLHWAANHRPREPRRTQSLSPAWMSGCLKTSLIIPQRQYRSRIHTTAHSQSPGCNPKINTD
uniref:Uncharacterized protein n=1 Tax=Pipistrellus kuhlii TaxID=59472 RepID=A0A7J8A9P9_PIPKU|nr:hypothetical protein mPipKuh1_009046 [Pipistrellus kuhlii]